MHHGFAQPWRRATHISCCLEHASAGAGCARAGPHRAWRRAGRRRRGRRRRLGRGAQRLVAGARARAAGRRLRAAAQAAQQAARGPRRGGRRAVAGRRGRRGRHCRERAGRRLRARLRTGARMSRHEAGRSQGPLRCPAHGAGPVRGTRRGRLAAGACHAARLGPARRAGEGRREGGAARTACPQGRAPRRLVQARPRSGGRCHAWHRRRTAGHAGWGPSEGARPGRGRAGVRAGPALLVRGRRRGIQARVRGNGRGRRAPVGVLRPGLHRARDGHAARVAQHDHQARAQQLRARPDAPGSARGAGRGAWGDDRRAGLAPTVQAATVGRTAPAALLPADSKTDGGQQQDACHGCFSAFAHLHERRCAPVCSWRRCPGQSRSPRCRPPCAAAPVRPSWTQARAAARSSETGVKRDRSRCGHASRADTGAPAMRGPLAAARAHAATALGR